MMNDKKEQNDGSMSENAIIFRISTNNKEKIRDYFGSFSEMREYVLKAIENKGEDVKREDKK